MSAMDFKNTDLDFSSYAPPAVSSKEIDLLGLLDILITAKTHCHHYLCFRAGRSGNCASTAAKWTSKAVITPAEQTQWNPLSQMMVALQVLDVKVPVTRQEVFDLFIKNSSRSHCLKSI